MSRHAEKIGAGIRSLLNRPYEIASGVVTAIDDSHGTATIQLSDNSEPIKNVRIQAITGTDEGCRLVPETGSHVIIGSIDGPGEWVILTTSELQSAKIKIGNIECEIGSSAVVIKNGGVLFEVSSSVFKVKTGAESLFDILKDLISQIRLITVPTPAGASGTPVNATAFTTIETRLSNLLSN